MTWVKFGRKVSYVSTSTPEGSAMRVHVVCEDQWYGGLMEVCTMRPDGSRHAGRGVGSSGGRMSADGAELLAVQFGEALIAFLTGGAR